MCICCLSATKRPCLLHSCLQRNTKCQKTCEDVSRAKEMAITDMASVTTCALKRVTRCSSGHAQARSYRTLLQSKDQMFLCSNKA